MSFDVNTRLSGLAASYDAEIILFARCKCVQWEWKFQVRRVWHDNQIDRLISGNGFFDGPTISTDNFLIRAEKFRLYRRSIDASEFFGHCLFYLREHLCHIILSIFVILVLGLAISHPIEILRLVCLVFPCPNLGRFSFPSLFKKKLETFAYFMPCFLDSNRIEKMRSTQCICIWNLCKLHKNNL